MPTSPSKRRSLRFGKEAALRPSLKATGSVPDLQQLSLNSFFKKPPAETSTSPNASTITSSSSHHSHRESDINSAHTESKRVNDTEESSTSSSSLSPPLSTTGTSNNDTSTSRDIRRPDPSQILKGVIACLDIRTEDGDDVSQSFERALQSMGAKTRRTFSDSITHLIFKNGSTATLRKALGKKVLIVNLLWITYCKREGRRLAEKDFLIDRPQGLIMSAKKRRKSMEPGKVKALEMEASTSTASTSRLEMDGAHEHKRKRQRADSVSEPRTRRLSEKDPGRRKHQHSSMIDNSTWKAEDILEEDEEDDDQEEDEQLVKQQFNTTSTTDISLNETSPVDDDSGNSNSDIDKQKPQKRSIAAAMKCSNDEKQKTERKRESKLFTPEMRERSNQIRAQIKADFFVRDVESPKPSSPKPSRLSLGSNNSTPLRRKRRSMGGNHHARPSLPAIPASTPEPVPLTRATTNTTTTITAASSSLTSLKPRLSSRSKTTIVMTGMTQQVRDRCRQIVDRLGTYELATFVDSRTSHVILGSKRRTETVLSGMIKKLWIVTPEWLFKSGESGKYLDEDEFEATDFFERVSIARTSNRQLLPSNLHIFIHSVFTLTKDSMQQLIVRANGRIVLSLKDADVVISKMALDTDKIVINENWLFDCIERWKYLPFDKYIISKS
ncbi:hypothetical protein BDB00DRAFT_472675 [Zychaea mexicana]|uniref:uncharacterized protein n=1 Tax=Zychaea mexicana TaxID=64656 RepID=UPI0022FE327D|nr:uncharacterized protein BDB00DRAFT_472675 [Zychaea mexicana]KAI9491782.1 hypothetical protein BDB00DRAFT_472675 [Zychaea mexicana]